MRYSSVARDDGGPEGRRPAGQYGKRRNMNSNDPIALRRDVEAAIIPVGSKVTLQKGEQAHITQSLGGSYTVIVNGNMFRIEGADADALGMQAAAKPVATGAPVSKEQLEKEVWNQMRSCYDPEIP